MNVAQETLGFRRAGLSPALSLLMSAFALPIPPAGFSPHLHRPTERSPTVQATEVRQQGTDFSAGYGIARLASWRALHTHLANAATSLRLHTLNHGSSESIPSSRPRTRCWSGYSA